MRLLPLKGPLVLFTSVLIITLPTALVRAANSTAGKALYDKHCAFCHGPKGLAETPVGRILNPRPRRFANPVEMARLSDDQIYHAIKSGVPGTAMASWGKVLSEREIGDVMDYIRGLRGTSKPMTRKQLSLAVGRRIYDKECAFCHGRTGHADTDAARVLQPRPSNFADPIAMARTDDARIYAAIKMGRPGTAMASWGSLLTPVEIIDVMRYIRSLQEPLPKGISPERAEIAVGRNIYSTYCVNCHGPSGKADTPLGQVLSPRPRNFTDRSIMAQLSDEQMATAIGQGKPGTAMAPWGGILSAEDIQRVIRYIRATFAPQQAGDGQAESAR